MLVSTAACREPTHHRHRPRELPLVESNTPELIKHHRTAKRDMTAQHLCYTSEPSMMESEMIACTAQKNIRRYIKTMTAVTHHVVIKSQS